MDALGSISSYALAMQQLQLNVIKQSTEAEQQLAEVLIEASRNVAPSTDKGVNIDITV